MGFQAVSASGPLIIEDEKKPPYSYEKDRIVFLQELFNKTDAVIEKGLQANPFVFSGETNGFLINGATISNYAAKDNKTEGLAVITVNPAKTYRFRWIGAHSLSYTSMGIEQHSQLSVIEADGAYTKKTSTDFLQLGSGQRFSTLIQTMTCDQLKQAGRLDFYIQVESRERPSNTTNYAILRYNNTCPGVDAKNGSLSTSMYPAKKPVTLPPTVSGFLDYQLRPLKSNNFPSAAEVTRRVTINVQQRINHTIIWQDADVTWTAEYDPNEALDTTPTVPYLVALYQNNTSYLPSYSAAVANGGVDPHTKTFPGKIGEVVEIVFQNLGAVAYDGGKAGGVDVHPFHAHGAHYYDLGGGPGAFDENTAEQMLAGKPPVLRDTTMLFRYNATVQPGQQSGWRRWRLRVTEPGAWMIHCHTLQHMLMGMQTVWIFGDTKDILKVPKPEVEGYLTYGGNAYGNSKVPAVAVHFFDVEDQTPR